MTAQTQFQIGNALIEVVDAPEARFPGGWFIEANINMSDCNSPCWWSDGTFYMLNSAADPWRSYGPDVFHLPPAQQVKYTTPADGWRWIESMHQEPDGTLIGWYHNEPRKLLPESVHEGRKRRLTAPRIGQAVSRDNGATWEDMGVVLEVPYETMNLQTHNGFFTGGNGDFSVILDRSGTYFYFLISTYYTDPALQGIALARMAYADRGDPVGKVTRWYNSGWNEPGLGGLSMPHIQVYSDWHSPNPDAFWGPSVHYNTHLNQYVILYNRAVDPDWKQEGIYISLTPDISDPTSWTPPQRILEGYHWYPQVVGLDFDRRETDREAGQRARLYITGHSRHELRFSRIGA